MDRTNNRYSAIIFAFCAAYKLFLDYLYVRYISSSYKFYGFFDNFSVSSYILSWIIFFFFTVLIIRITIKSEKNFSSQLLFLYYLVYFVPFTSMLYAGYKSNYIIFTILVWSFLLLYMSVLSKRKISFAVNSNRFGLSYHSSMFLFLFLSGMVCFSVLYLSWKFTGLRISFDEAKTYIYRVEAFDYQTSALMGYLYSWSRIIIPVLLCISITQKKYVFAAILFILKMLGFGYDGMRLDLLITIIAVIMSLYFQNRECKRLFAGILLAMIALCILSIIEHEFHGSGEIDRVITFRVLFLPNLIASWFIRFFESNPPDYFRQSFLRYLGFVSPYAGAGLDYIISDFISGGDGRANNGLIADAMTNFGAIGFVFAPFFVAIWGKIVDTVTKHTHISITLMMAVYFSYCLTNNFFLIILFTNGGFIVVILLALMERINKKRNGDELTYMLDSVIDDLN